MEVYCHRMTQCKDALQYLTLAEMSVHMKEVQCVRDALEAATEERVDVVR
jgi:hypothetical protein